MSSNDISRAETAENGMLLVAKAADFAARVHVTQRRKGAAQEPYINHLAEVALLLTEATNSEDAEVVAAGWLHDTLEDTETEFEELEAYFGQHIASLVAEVTDNKSLPRAERKRMQIETTPKKSDQARLIKLADKTSNLRSIAKSPPIDWNLKRREEYIRWAEAVAKGCRGLNSRLEQLFDQAANNARAMIGSAD